MDMDGQVQDPPPDLPGSTLEGLASINHRGSGSWPMSSTTQSHRAIEL